MVVVGFVYDLTMQPWPLSELDGGLGLDIIIGVSTNKHYLED